MLPGLLKFHNKVEVENLPIPFDQMTPNSKRDRIGSLWNVARK